MGALGVIEYTTPIAWLAVVAASLGTAESITPATSESLSSSESEAAEFITPAIVVIEFEAAESTTPAVVVIIELEVTEFVTPVVFITGGPGAELLAPAGPLNKGVTPEFLITPGFSRIGRCVCGDGVSSAVGTGLLGATTRRLGALP